ncbi:hypothetical protein ENUP19_0324G0008 [Entamoeba nuttalli]|uniref:Antibiotic biosynthesis monooxygenase domain containing protein n=2 Tax=Entamoeba nuttalli TaxID=412467 RepID=K2GZX0_ENTNP|nr:antibiotic biosynthesis monooxygenase domain containing protein [Entamoeba nuttalli P19]EKE40733.1 antibiotic biosynthesis monooxygenase domain containing protein [Entamoeba nuttalli P19]|eukprot:XP_008856933.1 antibiotic biosynthesis monooxygenase domain containing protein [Entamoeba nuttalli P19]
MVVIVHCHMYLKEDPELLAEVTTMVNASRKDPGCISYSFVNEVTNTTHYIMIEEWESQEKLDAHMKTTHFAQFINFINKISTKESNIEVLTATKA